jgi:SAM-dependent methyltransferase
LPDSRVNSHQHIEAYYRDIQGYHQLVEDRSLLTFVVPPELVTGFMDPDGLTLDIAGGSGINAKILGLKESKYVCADLASEGLRIAAEQRRGMCVQAEVGKLPVKNGAADSVLCSWSVEHLLDPEAVFNEMIRILKPGGRILIWGPNWDNVFRKDFPQFAHKNMAYIWRVRFHIFFKMIKNEFLPFRYSPYINPDVAALADPRQFISGDTDAVHCVLCQETVKFFRQKGLRVVHMSDFSEMGKHLRNDFMIRAIRTVLSPLLPLLRRVPLVRWFAIRFPIVLEKP